jgi:hypothetical protein
VGVPDEVPRKVNSIVNSFTTDAIPTTQFSVGAAAAKRPAASI